MRRSVAAVVALVAVVAVGCTTIAPAASVVITVPVQNGSPGASAPSAAASAEPSIASASSAPTVSVGPTGFASPPPGSPTPGPTPKPTKSPKPSGPALANLVVTDVTLGADPWPVNTDTLLNVTVKNDGSTDAARFYVEAEAVTADGNNTNDFGQMPVDSLAPGASTQVAFNARVTNASDYTITATADYYDDIKESNEHDNDKSIQASAVSMPNLYVDGGLQVLRVSGTFGYEVDFTIGNSGSADAPDPSLKIFAYDAAKNVSDLGSYQLNFPLTAGQKKDLTYDFQLGPQGDHQLYVMLDPDNEAEADVTVP